MPPPGWLPPVVRRLATANLVIVSMTDRDLCRWMGLGSGPVAQGDVVSYPTTPPGTPAPWSRSAAQVHRWRPSSTAQDHYRWRCRHGPDHYRHAKRHAALTWPLRLVTGSGSGWRCRNCEEAREEASSPGSVLGQLCRHLFDRPRAWSQVELMVPKHRDGFWYRCAADHLGHANDYGPQRRCSDTFVVAQDRKRPQTSSRSGMPPIGLVPGIEATSVSAGQRRVFWAWLDLNQRPHPYQGSRAKRCAERPFPRSLASVRGEGTRS